MIKKLLKYRLMVILLYQEQYLIQELIHLTLLIQMEVDFGLLL